MLQLLENLLSRKNHRKGAAKPARAPGSAKDGAGTQISSDWPKVAGRLGNLGAGKILLHGDAAAFAAALEAFSGTSVTWISHTIADLGAGAAFAEDLDWTSFDAAVCAGGELTSRYRQAIRLMAAGDRRRPVFWVGEGFEFCGGTLSAPAEADEVEGLLFNHFQEFFGIKDALQFRIEIYHGPEVKTYYRILDPNQSHVIRLSDHVPARHHPVSLAAFVEHPLLTRGRHYRLRLCADVFWRDSFTTLHSAHEFGRSPSHKVEFRAPAWLVRKGQLALTIPNYERNAGADAEIEAVAGGRSTKVRRGIGSYLEQSNIDRDGLSDGEFFGWRYRGYGGSNCFALEDAPALDNGHAGSIAGNHHVSCPIEDRPNFAASHEEIDRYRQVDDAGFVLEPHPVPIMAASDDLVFGYESDAANPAFGPLRIDYFSASGSHLGTARHDKTKPGPLFGDDLVGLWDSPERSRAKLALVSNDWARGGLKFGGFKPMTNLIVRNRKTLDQDFTEFQSCWRNLGSAVPGFPHWLTDQLAVVGRTNVFGRVRCDRSMRTGIVVCNGSGRLAYRGSARTDVVIYNSGGRRMEAWFDLPAFTWKLLWLDELFPSLPAHLGTTGNGALLVQSGDADLNCQIVTTTPQGAVSLQHLWGY